MSEWWTYGLSDFLMFSPETYWRLVGRHNAAGWPAQVLGLAAAAALLGLVTVPRAGAARAALLVLAGAWAWTAWAFLAQRYAEIFLAARWLALAGGLQAVLLLAAALLPAPAPHGKPASRPLGFLLLLAALLFPLLGPASGRGWSAAEVFGWMPDPTALATLGALLALPWGGWLRATLAVLPVLALLLGGATRWLLA